MKKELKLTGYFAGALFTAQELYGNCILAAEINRVSRGLIRMDLPQDMSTQEAGDDRGIRSADYLGMIQRDFVFANMNGPELDSGTVAEYVAASMLGMPRVQFRSDFRNAGDVRRDFPDRITIAKLGSVPYNLMLGHDGATLVYVNSMALYKNSSGLPAFLRKIAVAAVQGIQMTFRETQTAEPDEYASFHTTLVRDLKLNEDVVTRILKKKRERHLGDPYRRMVRKLAGMSL